MTKPKATCMLCGKDASNDLLFVAGLVPADKAWCSDCKQNLGNKFLDTFNKKDGDKESDDINKRVHQK